MDPLCIKSTDGILQVPCIRDRGDGPGRCAGSLWCEIDHGGQLVTPSGDPLDISRLGHDLRGWGDFDGTAYDVTNGVWHVSVSALTMQQLVKRGLVLPC